MARIAFIGLGNMGGPMAMNLLKAGHEVTVFDLVPESIQALVDHGASSSTSAAEAVKNAEVVISMLPAGKHVKMLFIEDQDLVANLSKGCLVLDASTIDAASARLVSESLATKGIHMMDTPVSGGVAAATAGTLSFMCGGEQAAFEKAKEILSAMGQKIFHAGGAGAGQIAKICNNMLLSVLMVGTSEALKLGQSYDLDPSVLSEIMLASSGRNWTLEVYNPCPGVMETAPSSKDYQPGFMVDLMCKDLGLAMQAALESGSATPMGALARSLYASHQSLNDSNGKLDFSSIFEAI